MVRRHVAPGSKKKVNQLDDRRYLMLLSSSEMLGIGESAYQQSALWR
jgi:hypothetical protein